MSTSPFDTSNHLVTEGDLEANLESFLSPANQDNLCLVEKKAGVWIIPREVLVTYCRFVPCGSSGLTPTQSDDGTRHPSQGHDLALQPHPEPLIKSPTAPTEKSYELSTHKPSPAAPESAKRKSDTGLETSRKKPKIPETDEEIATHGVEKIISGLPTALNTLDIGSGRTVEDFLQEYKESTGDNENDAFWRESMKVSKEASVYRWVLRYISSCKGICLGEASDAADEREDKFRFRWRALTSGMNQLVDLLWDKYGLLALVILTAMAG